MVQIINGWDRIMAYSIRKAVQEDEQRICELFMEMLQTIYHTEDVQGYEPGYLDRFWNNGEDIILVAEDDVVIAYLSVEVHREEAVFIYLDDLSVTEKKRGNGIGTSLIHKAEDYAKELGISDILLHVEKTNTSALRLYERLGYKISKDVGNRYLMKR